MSSVHAKSSHLHILREQSEEVVLLSTENALVLPLEPEAKYQLVDDKGQLIEDLDVQFQEKQVEISSLSNPDLKVILKSTYPTSLLTESMALANDSVVFNAEVLAKYAPVDFEQSVLYKSLFGALAIAGATSHYLHKKNKKQHDASSSTEETTAEQETPVIPQSETSEAQPQPEETPKSEEAVDFFTCGRMKVSKSTWI